MTTTNTETPELERELHELEASSDALDQRTGNLERRGGLGLLFSFFAIAIALAALAVALVNVGNDKTSPAQQSSAPASGSAGSNAPAVAPAAPIAPGTVAVKLGEFFLHPSTTSVAAGKVTFQVRNTGKLVHEMIVARAPVKLQGSRASEKTSVGEVSELQPGTSGRVKLTLKPGNYVFFCNVPGHYAAGQHIAFTVTKS
jgi:uncharacterized cupredoxin-like copper-binding protein